MRYVILVLSLLLCGCSPINIEPARQSVNTFHELYQRGDYSKVYDLTSSNLQKTTLEKDFIGFMVSAKENDLGSFIKSNLRQEKITRSLFSNNEVSFVYYSKYSKRFVQEIFTFEMENKRWKLKSYRYDSLD
ncbi:type IV secretion protein Rhs [Trabulsiella odontotermitis]|uniref:type IV secretion protein Rhs n=1 Tax=Trabulsiella odontotermitis TaxID=379893 RepID=UPI0024B65D62|nr:type IV secretion protein Rhs [Trabulsiella odontotermitis]WHP32743.1 type IV secretion protein Rhs [Trabulsiella odontotermitis]